jgi:adenylate cyclase
METRGSSGDTPRVPRKVLQGLLIGAVGALLAAALMLPGILDSFEAKTWDLRARLLARPGPATDRVVTILLDQGSLNWAKKEQAWSWPWPREAYAAIAAFCKEAGARALVFDLIYTEPSSYGVSDDEAFGQGLADNGRVVGAMNLAREEGQGADTAWPQGVPVAGFTVEGLEAWVKHVAPRSFTFPRAQFPIPELVHGARMLANTNLPTDSVDGVYRREPLFSSFDNHLVPSEAMAAWLVGNPGAERLTIRPGTLTVGDITVPIDAEGRAILRYRGPSQTHKAFSAASVIQAEAQILEGKAPDLDPARFRDKYVLVGVTAPGLYDLKPTPMSGPFPGMEVNATALDNLLSGDYMRTVPPAFTLVLLFVLCFGAGLSVSAVSGAWPNLILYVGFLALAPALCIGAYALGFWLPMVGLEVGIGMSLVGGSLASYATEGRQKRYIKGAFKQYLSPAVIEELIAHPERLTLGGERRELTIFFSDVQGFTGISEALTPEELTALLNEYLSAMTDIIQDEGGTIDKFEGDAIIAFWNAPLSQEDHAVRGVRAAMRCQKKLAEMRSGFRARIGKDMFVRVGMNTGPAVVGNMGSKTRFDYTMLGDQVNLAARLEGINKQFRTYTMISASVVKGMAGAFPVRELSRVAVVGRKEPVTVYEPLLPEDFAAHRQALETFDKGLQGFYAGRFEEAARIFAEIATSDPPAAAYEKKCQELAASPPVGGWNGVWVMTEK